MPDRPVVPPQPQGGQEPASRATDTTRPSSIPSLPSFPKPTPTPIEASVIHLTASLTKKIPHPTLAYGSIGASLSLEVECAPGQDLIQEAERLYRQLSLALDVELARQAGATSVEALPPGAPTTSPTPLDRIQGVPPPVPDRSPAQPSPRRSRGPAPVTASQLRLLERLFSDQPNQRTAVMERCHVQALDQLSCRQASEAIDQLKGVVR